jgi:hypothetical protein
MLEYSFRIIKRFYEEQDRQTEDAIISVAPPYEVLFDLSNLPSISQAVDQIRKVVIGEMASYEFGWHRVECTAYKDVTEVIDNHAEDLGSLPYFEIPTAEILKMLEEYQVFYENWRKDWLERLAKSKE